MASATSTLTEYAAYRAFIWDNNMYWSSAVLSKTDGAAVTYLDAEPFECRAIYLSISSPYYNFNYIAPLEHTGIVEYTVDGEHWIEVSRKVYTTSDYTLAHIFEVSAPKIRGLRYRALTPNTGASNGSFVMCNSLIALA